MEAAKANLFGILSTLVEAINATKFFAAMDLNIGVEELQGSSMKAPPAIFFRPLYDTVYSGPHEQPDDSWAFYETETVVEVTVWGKDLAETENLRNAVLITANVLWTPNAVQTHGKADYSKGLSSELGMMIKYQIGFRIPIVYETFLQAVIQTVDFINSPTVVGPDGEDPEPLPDMSDGID